MSSRYESVTPPPLRPRTPLQWILQVGLGSILLSGSIIFIPVFIWFFCRIEPGPGQIAVLIKKTGKDLPSGQILALQSSQKGIQLDVLAEGRYFRNPYTWDWKMSQINDIPAGKLGVVTRLYGEDLPQGKIIADDKSKGILPEVLRPGKYRINPYAFSVEQFDAISVRPGYVGVMTCLVGTDVLNGQVPEEKRNAFLVDKDMKGVVNEVLTPGTYYLNPYMYSVAEVNLQSQRFAMGGDDAISFLTMDGFTVAVEGTIEFSIQQEKAALLTHRVGDMDDIVRKVIMPRARGFSRIEGSKHPAINFIVGETRQQFQKDLENHLSTKCEDWGVLIKSVLIRNIIPPDEIASVIRDREVAVQDSRKYEQQTEQAKSMGELVKQEMLAQQNKEKVDAETIKIKAVIAAKQEQAVRVVAAQKDLEVAKLDNQAADSQAQSIILEATAQRDVIKMRNEAESSVLAGQANAFGSGMGFSRYTLYNKIGPRIGTLLSTDQDEGLGAIFKPFLPTGKGVSQ